MSHIALYRKYRPSRFQDVIGQEHIVSVLEGALSLGRISHAYLFSGSRGTGKTSIARIFAKELGTAEVDMYEIDAASNTGVDDIRALNEAVSTLPFQSKYKIYILDEVHMLSKSAFNALLKTLEEPPSHVIFILATTELEKVPETVVSRCQTFAFKKPSQKILKDIISSAAKKEGFTLAPSSAELIALLGDGSFRDAYSILEKVLSFSEDKKISPEEVAKVTGAPRVELVNAFIKGIEEKDPAQALSALRTAEKENIDAKVFLTLALEKIRAVLLLRFAKDMEGDLALEFSEEDFALLKSLSLKKDLTLSSETVLALLTAGDSIQYASVGILPLELAAITLTK